MIKCVLNERDFSSNNSKKKKKTLTCDECLHSRNVLVGATFNFFVASLFYKKFIL